MTKFQTILLAILAFAVAGALYKFVPGIPELAMGAASLGALLAGWAKQHPADRPEPAKPSDKSQPPVPPAAVALALFAGLGLLGYSVPARADINLNDIAPKLTYCKGATCVQPAASVNAVMYNLSQKKWETGTTALGGGLELLFAADQAYSSGLVAHVGGLLSQDKPSYALMSFGIVLARYLELAYSRQLSIDRWTFGDHYASAALTLPWDLLATGKSLPARAAAARSVARVQEGDTLHVGDF